VAQPSAASSAQYGGPQAAGGGRVRGEVRSPVREWLLSIVTIGIYGIFWYIKVQKEIKTFNPAIEVEPIWKLFIPILNILSWMRTGELIAQVQGESGKQVTCSKSTGLLLGLVGFGVFYYQGELNKAWEG
jgi:hypothetical protein